jgi:hypothetical protein
MPLVEQELPEESNKNPGVKYVKIGLKGVNSGVPESVMRLCLYVCIVELQMHSLKKNFYQK